MNRALIWNTWARLPGNHGRWHRFDGEMQIGWPVHIQDGVARRCQCGVSFMQGIAGEKHPTRPLVFVIFGGHVATEMEDVGDGFLRIVQFVPQFPAGACDLSLQIEPGVVPRSFDPPQPWTPESDGVGDVGA
jgi:hypothetical protein